MRGERTRKHISQATEKYVSCRAMAVTIPAAPRRDLFEPEHNDYRESFRTFLQAEVVPHYATWEADHLVPRELFTKCAEHGFLAIEVPDEHGGNGVSDWRFNVVLNEEAVRAGVADAMAGPLLHSDVVLPYLITQHPARRRARGGCGPSRPASRSSPSR